MDDALAIPCIKHGCLVASEVRTEEPILLSQRQIVLLVIISSVEDVNVDLLCDSVCRTLNVQFFSFKVDLTIDRNLDVSNEHIVARKCCSTGGASGTQVETHIRACFRTKGRHGH